MSDKPAESLRHAPRTYWRGLSKRGWGETPEKDFKKCMQRKLRGRGG
jgi:hypothetical protein